MSDNEQSNQLGVNILGQKVLRAGHLFRPQPISDYGIDAQIEIKDGAIPTGRLIAVQIKAGDSYFSNEVTNGFWHYICDRHRNLWINHSLPVILVLCDLDTCDCYYEVVSSETCVRAGENWKLFVPKSKPISSESSPNLVDIASPIVAASDYSILEEQDQSSGLARRISLDLVIHPGTKPVSRHLLGAIIRAALKRGQSSQYHRDENSETKLAGQPVDVVWGFVYLRDIDRESAAWACRFQWISPSLEASSRLLTIAGEEDGSGLVIDWDGKSELSKLLDERRATKAEYLKSVDRLLTQLPEIEDALDSLLESGDQSPHAIIFTALAESFEGMWDSGFAAPGECQRLDQAIHELIATVGNAGLIWNERASRGRSQVQSLVGGYRDDLNRLQGEISFLRSDVR